MEPDDSTFPPDAGTAAPVPPAAGELAFGHFLVPRRADGSLWELGRGAMGVTYRAFDTSLRTEVALKVIHADRVQDEDTRRRFQREARAAAKIRHPNIASVLYLGEQGGEFFYAMEFVAGRSLDALLRDAAAPLPPMQAVALTAQAAAALNAAHRREVVHRDLKPANLMLLENDALDHTDERTEAAGDRLLKVIDFGLARRFGAGRQEDSLVTQTFAGFVGTPAYASPEQCSGETDLDGRSDLYSLGVILWQMLTGRLPFAGRVAEVIGKQQFQAPPLGHLDGLPAPVVELIVGLLVKDPAERRPQSAGELRTILDRLLRAAPAAGASDASAGSGAGGGLPVAMHAAAAAGMPPPPTVTPTEVENARVTRDSTTAPAVGTTLITRYRLGREVSRSAGGRLYLAADNLRGDRPVALKLLSSERLRGEPEFAARVETALERGGRHPHPVFLAQIGSGLERSGESVFYVREWADGFSLDELLRARQGALRAGEVFALLDTLPEALDFAAARELLLLEVALCKLFVVPRTEGAGGGGGGGHPARTEDWAGLRTRPLAEWPGFVLKLNPLGFAPGTGAKGSVAGGGSGNSGDGEADWTMVQRRVGKDGRAPEPVAALARLTRELLGAPADGLGPLSALNDQANAVLRRALDPTRGSGGTAAYGSAADFWRTLREAAGIRAMPVTAASLESPGEQGFQETHADHEAPAARAVETVAIPAAATPPLPNPTVRQAPATVSSSPARPGRRKILGLAVVAVAAVVLLAGIVLLATGRKGAVSGQGSVEGGRTAKDGQDSATLRLADSPSPPPQPPATAEERSRSEKALQDAVAALNLAKDNFVRARGLFDKKVVNKADLDQNATNLQAMEANVAAAQVEIRRTHEGMYASYAHDRAAAILAQARATRAIAQLNFDRQADLFAKKVASKEEYQQNARTLREADADVQMREIDLERVGVTDAAQIHRLDLAALKVLNELQAADDNDPPVPSPTPAATANATSADAITAAAPQTGSKSKLRLVPADYRTIQSALDAAVPGDTVLVGPGTYFEALKLTKDDIELRGTDRDKVIVCQGAQVSSCLQILNRRFGRVSSMTFEHTGVEAAKADDRQLPVVFSNSSKGELRDCTVRRGVRDGILLYLLKGTSNGDVGFTVSGCTVESCGQSGIVVASNLELAPTDVLPRLRDNICRNNKQDGIRCKDGASAVLEENFCTANGKNGIAISGKGNRSIVTANRCSNNGEYGIFKDKDAPVSIDTSNVFFGNGVAGVGP